MQQIKLPIAKDDHGTRPVRDSKSRRGGSVVTMGFLHSSGKPGIKVPTVEMRLGWN